MGVIEIIFHTGAYFITASLMASCPRLEEDVIVLGWNYNHFPCGEITQSGANVSNHMARL